MRTWWGRLVLPRRLRAQLPPQVAQVLQTLADAQHEAYLVGGCVRDLLLGRTPHDWDVATSAAPERVAALFASVVQTGVAHGTVIVIVGGTPVEVTQYRAGDTLAADLAHRDLTVNAMALSLAGQLIDPLGGWSDLRRGVARAPGRAVDRLAEDPLRALRAIRVAAGLNLELDPQLAAALPEVAPRLGRVAPERLGQEFTRLLTTDRPGWALEEARKAGLLAAIAPELLEGVGLEQNEYHAYTVWEHIVLACQLTPPDPVLRWAGLLHDIGKPRCLSTGPDGRRHFYRHELVGADMADDLLTRWRLPGDVRRRVVHLVRYHMDLHLDMAMSDSAIRRMIRRIGRENIPDLLEVRRADRLASGTRTGDLGEDTLFLLAQIKRILQEDAAWSVRDLAISGRDVMAELHLPPGPAVGRVLEAALEWAVEEPARNRREALLAWLQQEGAGAATGDEYA